MTTTESDQDRDASGEHLPRWAKIVLQLADEAKSTKIISVERRDTGAKSMEPYKRMRISKLEDAKPDDQPERARMKA